jgi:Glycosyl hydrolase catalytic core
MNIDECTGRRPLTTRLNFPLSSLAKIILAATAFTFGGLGACDSGQGKIGSTPGTGGIGSQPPPGSTGAAGTAANPTGTAGSIGSGSGAGTGNGTGAAGTGSGTGAAGTGAAGTSGTGAAGTGSGTGAAGTRSGTGGTAPSGGADAAAGSGSTVRDAGASEPAGPPVSHINCKRGEAYASNSVADLQTLSKGMTWWYNWTTSPEKAVAADFDRIGIEFVPMIWGGDPNVATIVKQIPNSAKYLLGFNEPNFGAQSHIPAPQAAALWPKIEDIARQKNLMIGSPSPNYCAGNCNDTDPIHYLDTFFAACTGCKVDFIAAHWYACTGDALKNYLAKLKKYGKPIWLTEFSCMDAGDHSEAGELAYMKTAVAILEADPMIFRYSWFTGRWPNPAGVSLLGASGQLTALGDQYMTLPGASVCGP